ncbi:MAG: GIY-YIG nuclease family protein [Deltaproteobacteria bacterium]|nr:GIY-YIG nuclease family protein [Deltaproteobacteria bacterium]
MPYYVYILCCYNGHLYYGYSGDLNRRLELHRQGKVRSTKPYLPVELVYYEIYQTAVEARKREKGFKNGRTRSKSIKRLIEAFLKEKLTLFCTRKSQG